MTTAESAPRVLLRVTRGPMIGRVWQFEHADSWVFGRAKACHARLPESDTSVSRCHFVLEVAPPRAILRDLGSRNGTTVNGATIGGRADSAAHTQRAGAVIELRDGDVITVGVHEIRVEMTRAREEASVALPLLRRAGTAETAPLTAAPSASLAHARTEQPDGAFVLDGLEPIERGAFEHYQLEALLGRGGMGVVFAARDLRDGARVALKLLPTTGPVTSTAVHMFQREIQMLASLSHPNIVKLREHGRIDAGLYLVMELCLGGSVDRSAQFHFAGDWPRAVRALLPVLDALSHAHTLGIVHRDVKPENVLIATQSDGGTIVKVADFGLAKSFVSAGLSGITRPDVMGGSVAFMPREQLTDFRGAGPSADVWSAAASIVYLVTEQYVRAFRADMDPLLTVLLEPPRAVRAMDPAAPSAIAAVFDRALLDEPSQRYDNAGAFAAALRAALLRS